MILKNISWAEIQIDYKGWKLTIGSNALVSLPEDKANELLRLYENKFQEVNDISNAVSDLDDYQKKLTAWDNIAIDDNDEISATDTTYTNGEGISISEENEISCTLEASDFDISDLADEDNILAWKQPVPTSWEWAPETTPTAVGLFYLDTTNSKMYLSFWTSAATDWKEIAIVSE